MSRPGKPSLEDIQARFRVVCICKGIKAGKIMDAIRAGATTVLAVNRATGSGNGGCGAVRCTPVITEMLHNGGKPPSKFPEPDPDEKGDDYWFPTPVLKKSDPSTSS